MLVSPALVVFADKQIIWPLLVILLPVLTVRSLVIWPLIVHALFTVIFASLLLIEHVRVLSLGRVRSIFPRPLLHQHLRTLIISCIYRSLDL